MNDNYSKLIDKLITTVETSLNIDSNISISENMMSCSFKDTQSLNASMTTIMQTIAYTNFYLNFKSIMVLEYELREYYGYDFNLFFNILNALLTDKTRNSFTQASIINMSEKVDAFIKKCKVKKTLIDRVIGLMLILALYEKNIYTAVLARFILDQLNLYISAI